MHPVAQREARCFGRQHCILYTVCCLSKTVSFSVTMKTVYYITIVDPSVRYDTKKFGDEVDMYLSDPDGWESKGYRFVRVKKPSNNTVRIHLSTPNTCHEMGCPKGLSCAELGGQIMRLNAMRWVKGAEKTKLDLDEYRQYVVSHEMGHILGFDHTHCPGAGQPVPVMVPQTKVGIGACIPNNKVNV
jgi:Protein of unknown function (DUF3152)